MIPTLIILLNLIILESLLSIDNAAVLSVMVKDLPLKDQPHALKWGLWGAYILRGVCLLAASWLVGIWWLKILGGLYLCYLSIGHFSKNVTTIEEGATEDAPGWAQNIKNFFTNKIGVLWSTIILVEMMDLVFSIDNIFAAVALSPHFYIIMTGVAIGMLAMRFIAGWFVKLLNKYPSLENSAFIVILLLGIKLIISGAIESFPSAVWANNLLKNHNTDLIFSAIMMLIFFIPLLGKKQAIVVPFMQVLE